MSSHPLFLRDSRESETRASMKITLREKRRHTAGEREKWGTTDKAQAFDPSRPTDFGVWSLYPLPNQLSSSNGIPSLIELSLLLSLVNYRGYLLQAKKKKQILIFFTAVLGEELDSVGNTPLLLMPKCCLFQWIFFLWRVDYALEENILNEQIWFFLLISYWKVMTRILIFCSYCLWSAWFALWCKSIFFDLFEK